MSDKPMSNRVIRVTDEVWIAAKGKAGERHETISAAIRRFLKEYAK